MKKNSIFLSVFLLLALANNLIAQAGLRTKNTNINISSGISLVIPGNVNISGGTDYILNNGNCYIGGDFTNSGNSFNTTASGTESFNGATTINGISYFNNFTILSGATVTLSSDINILNNWTNSSSFIPSAKTVTFRGNSDQTIIGNTTFYDLTENQGGGSHLKLAAAQTIITHNLTVSGGTMSPNNNTLIDFTGIGSLQGANDKNFYDLQIDNTSAMTITNGGVSISHNFVNNGIYTYSGASRLTTFGGSGVTQTFSGFVTSSTIFGTIVVGDNHPLSNAITLNCTNDYTIQGGSLSLSHNSTLNNTNNTATFSVANATVGGSGTANFYNATTNVALNLGTGISNISHYLMLNTGGSILTNAPFYGSSATLVYNTTTASLSTGLEWTNNTNSTGAGAPFNVIVQNSNNVVMTGGSKTIPGALTISPSNSLNINDKVLTVNGMFSGTGYLRGSANSGLITGSSSTGMGYFSPVSPYNQLKTLTINGNLTLGGSAVAGDTLNIVPGNSIIGYGTVKVDGILNTNGVLNLKSNSVGTARIDQSAGIIQDSVTIERFIPGLRAWRFLAIPFSNSNKTIRDAWQEGVNNYGLGVTYNKNPKPGYGTHITGDNISTNGFDLNTTTNPSMKVWDPVVNGWSLSEPHTISANISAYRAYCLFVRGSRAVDLSQGVYAATDSTVIRATGILNETGAISLQSYNGNAGNFIFVGNPYASPINILRLINNTSGIDANKFWVWDPKRSGNYNVGGYVTYSGGMIVPSSSPSYPDAASALLVESGQAFMVQLSVGGSGAASLNFQENDKTASESNVFGKQSRQLYPAIYINLEVPTANGSFISDGVGAGFRNDFSSAIDAKDAKKLWNFDENIALVRHDTTLAIEFRPIPKLTDTLFLRLYLRKQPYALQMFTQNFENFPSRAWLIDKYLHTETEINLYDTTLYNFAPYIDSNGTADTTSYRNRFMLVFNHQLTGTPIPVTKVVNQANPDVTANANSINAAAGNISIYPNPVSTGKAVLQFNNMDKGKYEATVYNSKGERLVNQKIQHSGGNNIYPLPLNASWVSGVYTIRIINQNLEKTINLQLIISK